VSAMEEATTAGSDWLMPVGCWLTPGGAGNGGVVGRLFNNTVYDMARYLVSTGDYSIETPEAQEETSRAAVSMAKRMYLLRAGASFVSPSAPSPQMVVEDRDGRVVTQMALMDEYRALQKDPGEKTKVNASSAAARSFAAFSSAFCRSRPAQRRHIRRAIAIYRALLAAGVVERLDEPDAEGRRVRLTMDLQETGFLPRGTRTH
jgi:hypothetical protein